MQGILLETEHAHDGLEVALERLTKQRLMLGCCIQFRFWELCLNQHGKVYSLISTLLLKNFSPHSLNQILQGLKYGLAFWIFIAHFVQLASCSKNSTRQTIIKTMVVTFTFGEDFKNTFFLLVKKNHFS